ncbi:hypothetical protein [Modestobacter sp. NPDC049651]|uniref:hypothetical protein n=1 Tax=unclassified Modestobacter TaxID=2643866 RepID=UPI0033F636C6
MPTATRGRAPSRGVLARAALPATVLGASVAAAVTAGVALAGPAAALEDPRRPAVEVTAGPSCGPAVVRVQVTNGRTAQHVALVFDGTAVQQEADLGPGEQVELGSADVDWGVTVDVSVTAVAADGAAPEPVELGTYTRPAQADCDAVSAPTTDVVPTPEDVPPAAPTTGTAEPAPPATTSAPTTPGGSATPSAPRTPSAPASSAPGSSDSSGSSAPGSSAGGGASSSSGGTVAPGGVVRVRATGFTPGEQVTVSLAGRTAPLATVAAGRDGSVEAVVQIPRAASTGTADVRLVGADSAATAGLALQVAARSAPVGAAPASSPPVATMAGVALLVAAGGLGISALRRPRDGEQAADLGR